MAQVAHAEPAASTSTVPCGAVVVFTGRRRDECDERLSALAEHLSESGGVEIVRVSEPDRAVSLALELRDAVLCRASDRRWRPTVPMVPVPTLVVGPRCTVASVVPRLSGNLLVCLDGSPRAEAVLPVAARWAGALGLDLTLLHVGAPGLDLVHAAHRDLLASGYLARTAARTGGSAPVNWEVLHGEPAKALVWHAQHEPAAALVAVNTHGESTPSSTRSGRVPTRVILNSTVPVLVTSRTRAPPGPPVTPRPPPHRGRRASRPRTTTCTIGPAPTRSARLRGPPPRPELGTTDPQRTTDRTRRRISRRAVGGGLALMVLLTAAALVVPISYYSIGGSTMTAGEMITVGDVVDDQRRTSVLVPIVRSRTVTPLSAFAGWLDPHVDVHPKQHRSDPDRRRGQRLLMTESGDIATMVVARRLGLAPGSVNARVDTHGLGGPSAGLAFALEVFDSLSPGEITSGQLIAATGTLDVDGNVGSIGAIRHKAFAARDAGAAVLVVPSDNYWAAVAAVPDVRVIAVSTFDEALEALRQLRGER